MASKLGRSTSVALNMQRQNRTARLAVKNTTFQQRANPDIIGFQIILDKLNYQSRSAAAELLVMLLNFGINIVTVESLTAGKIASTLVDIPSYGPNVYGGFVVYDSDAKREFVDVTTKSVYSQKCAKQMAEGALKNSRAMCALAVTGQAGGFDDTDPDFLGYVDMGFSYRTGEDTFVTATKRVKFCELKDIKPSCDEYKKRLKVLHKELPSMVDDKTLQEPFKGQVTSIQTQLSPGKGPLSDDLYQMRMIIRTACVTEACLFATQVLQNIEKEQKEGINYFKQFEGKIFTAKPRDTALKTCREPSSMIGKYIIKGTYFDNDYTDISWPEHFGDTGDERDKNYDAGCNQDDIPSSRPARNTRTATRNSAVPRPLSRSVTRKNTVYV